MENKMLSSVILNDKDNILNLLSTEDYQTNKERKFEKVKVDKLLSLHSMEYIDEFLKEVNKVPKWLVPADDKEMKRKTFRQSHEFSKLDEGLKVEKTDLSVEGIRNLKMLALNAEFLESSMIDVNKIKQAGLNVNRFIDKFDLESEVKCEADNQLVKDLASKCSSSAKILREVNSIVDSEIQVQQVADNIKNE